MQPFFEVNQDESKIAVGPLCANGSVRSESEMLGRAEVLLFGGKDPSSHI